MSKRIAQILVTYDVIEKALGLDEEHQITAIVPQTAGDVTGRRVGVIVTGPRMPLTAEGAYPVTSYSFPELAENDC